MSKVHTSRTVISPDVQIFRAKLTDTMRAATGDVALDTSGMRFHLFTLPPKVMVNSISLTVITASNAAGSLVASLGDADNDTEFTSAVSLKAVATEQVDSFAEIYMDATPVYLKVSGGTAPGTVGEIAVLVSYTRLDAADRVAAAGVDKTKYDAEAA